MITMAETVSALLGRTNAHVWYFYPQNWTQLPAVTWRESANRELSQADGREHLAEIEYSVEVWSRSPAQNADLAGEIDALMAARRFRRDYSADLFEERTGLHHRSLRYRCVADAAGNIYQ